MRLFFALFLILCSCSQRNDMKKDQAAISPQEVRKQQIQRTKHFGELVGRGVMEFRWSDDDGKHMEQGDVDFWKRGTQVSLRISKLGELLLWFGGNGDQTWMFDLMEKDTTLRINDNRAMFSDINTALVLLGLAPLPDGKLTVQDGVVKLVDQSNQQWTALYDVTTHRPLELIVVDGEHSSKALHRREMGVELEGVHELNWPITGGLIDVSSTHGEQKIKIAFESLSTAVSDEPMDRVFDLVYLVKTLKPVWTYTTKDD